MYCEYWKIYKFYTYFVASYTLLEKIHSSENVSNSLIRLKTSLRHTVFLGKSYELYQIRQIRIHAQTLMD